MRKSLRKPATILFAAFTILALATAGTFAGTGHSNGDNRLDNSGTNYKYGTENKKDGRGCGEDFSLVDSSYAPDYDVNADGDICRKYTGSGWDYTDNLSNS